ncbi:hypothetical protein [Tahibacter harae]|uniref:Uncharacterized protein n=1 Tax=Tahibacter harae TaxID=2963937 RepID=A0ABT1QTP6_9GAMM|nr:hypothetical protein [Tahibacter harae]MCQ4165661.1 hypothetical protein [Tahibacter harae]
MNTWLLAATVLAVVVGLIHSLLGEVLIFRRQPRDAAGRRRLQRPFDILWACWHIATVFGLALAALLWQLAAMPEPLALRGFLLNVVAIAYAVSALLVLFGTRGRHPGWAGLGGVAVLVMLA